MNKAILVVSFGTSYDSTRKKTIDAIEQKIAESFPDYKVYRAWTSKMIIKKLKSRDKVHIPTVAEALHAIYQEGIEEVIIQPTHILNGIENDRMIEEALPFSQKFKSLSIGNPLLTTTDDSFTVTSGLINSFKDIPPHEALIFMGHGTPHYANHIYGALNDLFRDKGYPQIIVGAVEAYPDIHYVLKRLEELKPQKVYLTPLMIVAGDHATNDMASEEEDSWKSLIESQGYPTEIIMKGLGEYPFIHDIFKEHIQMTISAN